MIELSAVTLHAMHTLPRPLTCPRAKVWMRKHSHPMREAAVPEMIEAILNVLNAPGSAFVILLAMVVIFKYVTVFRQK